MLNSNNNSGIKPDVKGLLTIKAATVSPEDVDPIPVVNIDLGIILEQYFRSWDFPVPGSPTSRRWGSVRILVPVSLSACRQLPPANTTTMANFTKYIP